MKWILISAGTLTQHPQTNFSKGTFVSDFNGKTNTSSAQWS